MKDYTLLVWGKDGGIIGSMNFGFWVETQEAIETARQEYPNAKALMDRATAAILWDTTGKLW